MKYASDSVGATSSIRMVTIGTLLLTARWTSRRICGEAFALDEKISTSARAWSMPRMMAAPHSTPGVMSRGAIQHLMPRASSPAQAVSAMPWSRVE